VVDHRSSVSYRARGTAQR